MKKVLHILASSKFSGAENVVCTIIENFKNEIDMAYCSPDGEISDILESKNIKFYPLKKLNVKELNKVLKQYNPDIIHAHDYTASVVVAMSTFKGKIISHIHNNCPFAKKWNAKTILYNLTIPRFNKIIGVSDKVYEEAIFKNRMKGKYQTIYNYVDVEEVIKKSNAYDYNKQYDIFFIGRLTKQKNPQKFIEIIRKISNENKTIKAAMIGDGELKSECKKMIDFYHLNNNIDLLGFVGNPFPIIKKCKICIMPSEWEGFGLTAIESLVLGKSVLNSGVGGLSEIFINDQQLICNSIDEYVNAYKNMKNNSFDRIIKRYTDKLNWKEQISRIYN